MIDTVN